MPVLLVDDGKSSARLGHYLHVDREGTERIEAFTSNSAATNIQDAEKEFQLVRNTFNKKDGREFFQAYISFEKRDLCSLARPDGMPG